MQFVKRHKIYAAVLGLPILLYALFLVFVGPIALPSRIHNELTLRSFARSFLEYPLPPQTTEISNSARWGTLVGNGNHCDFEVSRVLRTELSETEIRAYYADVEFLPIVPGGSALAAIDLNGMLGVFVDFDPVQPAIVTVSILDGVYDGTFWDLACS